MKTYRQSRKSRRDEPSWKRWPPTLVLTILSAVIHTVYVTFHTITFSVAMLENMLNTLKFLLVLAIEKKSYREPILSLPRTVTSCIKAQFQERERKNRGGSYFSKT